MVSSLPWATHAGEDVGLYAAGPFSWLFHATVDNTFVAQSMKFALCVEPYQREEHCVNHAHFGALSSPSMLLMIIFMLLSYQ